MGVPTYLGVDNIADLFMPIVDGDMWFECRMLMEATRFYDIEKVAQVACDKTWFNLDRPEASSARLHEAAVGDYNTNP
jgi:hypothetical protein